jgi:hypothetical protein
MFSCRHYQLCSLYRIEAILCSLDNIEDATILSYFVCDASTLILTLLWGAWEAAHGAHEQIVDSMTYWENVHHCLD